MIEETYRQRTPASAALMVRAAFSMPGGITRYTSFHFPYPLVIERAAGSELWDADGHRYIDLVCNYTSLVHGHAYPPVVNALRDAKGLSAWPAACGPQIELAELLCARLPSVERVLFCNSGTEAGMLSAKLARAVTGRHAILIADGGYHGSFPDVEPTHALTAPYGDAEAFARIIAERGREIAAVFVEPVQGAGGVRTGGASFLHRVRDAAYNAGALFVLDEVITLRLGEGGAQQLWDVRPDLTMLGKIIGGGLPVGALGGRADLMALLDPYAPAFAIHHGGTFNGNALTCLAGLVTMRHLTQDRIHHMDTLTERLDTGLLDAAASAGIEMTTRRVGSLVQLVLDPSVLHAFHVACLNRGVFVAPRGLLVTSTVLTEALVDEALERAAGAFSDAAAECVPRSK